MAGNSLRYSIMDETLYGSVGGASFSMRAFSGGGRGSTSGKERADLRHWSSSKKAPAKFDEKERGGPLPVGLYLVRYYGIHAHLNRCAALDQTLSSPIQSDPGSATGKSVTRRTGFYIHARGPKGSDGCIVPAIKADFKTLLDAIQAAAAPVTLVVHSEGMSADRLEHAKSWASTA